MPISSGLSNDHIRVGIVLPEDRINKTSLSWSSSLKISGDIPDLETIHKLDLSIEAGKIRISGIGRSLLVDQLSLGCSDQVESLATKYGIHIDPVIAGRGFLQLGGAVSDASSKE